MKTRPSAWLAIVLASAPLALPSCSVRFRSMDGYQFDFQGQQATRQQEGEIPWGIETVEVHNQFGAVHVEPTDGSPQWQWELTCWSTQAETAESYADVIELDVQQGQQTQSWVLTLPKAPAQGLRGVRSDLTLKVPASVRVAVCNSFGDTAIHDVDGSTVVESRHGNLDLAGLAGSVSATHAHGRLNAQEIRTAHLTNRHGAIAVSEVAGDLIVHNEHGEVVAEEVSGELEVANQHGRVIVSGVGGGADIQTAHASIEVTDVEGDALLRDRHGDISAQRIRGRLDAETQHGRIDLDVESPEVICRNKHGSIQLCLRNLELLSVRAETAHAHLRVRIPEYLSPVIEAETDFGKVRSEFPVLMAGTGPSSGSESGPEAPHIWLQNQHGNIDIEKVTDRND
jgi:hypothetical protein